MNFNDLPDEMMEIIIDHTQPGYDRRSRTLAQNKCRELLKSHEHDCIFTENLLGKLCLWFPTSHHLQYYTFLQELTRSLSPTQLETIVNYSLSERIRQMALIAQANQDHALAMILSRISQIDSEDDVTLVANHFRNQLRDQSIKFNVMTRLQLENLDMIALPDEISQFSSLIELDLSNNQLTYLPASLGQLNKLKNLNLSINQLTSVPASLGQLKKLTFLYLNENQLTSVPDSLGQMSKLGLLNLSKNLLTTIPDSLGNLSKLGYLFLIENQLISLPDSLGRLSNLIMLDISYNQLTVIPDSLGQLSKLVGLYLSQ